MMAFTADPEIPGRTVGEATTLEGDVANIAAIDAVPLILEVACRITGMGFAAVARVTEDRWIACQVRDEIEFGLRPGGELKLETTICNEIRASGQPVAIDHVAEDADYCGHPTPAMYGFQSYISVPITLKDGTFFGTLCAIDPQPARVKTPETLGMFKLYAELFGSHLNARDRLQVSEAALLDHTRTTELREQFIAVLGHDLRNPLAAIDAGVSLLRRKVPADREVLSIIDLVHSSVMRMSELIDNVLDFARGRLSDGVPVEVSLQPVTPVLQQVVNEMRAAWPNRAIETHFALRDEVACDRGRPAQLFSNLLGNALLHGAVADAVVVTATTDGKIFELSIANSGNPIPPAAMEYLFQPFYRAKVRRTQQGLGLGLYIASEIAKAHGGTLEAQSHEREMRFTFRMPIR